MTTRNSPPLKSKTIVAEANDHIHVGIDVHAKDSHISLWCVEKKGFVKHWVTESKSAAIVASLKPFRGQIVRIVYEAGPTGFGLVRALHKAGYTAEVISAAHIARPATGSSKCDRLDSRMLAKLSGNEDHHAIYTPTPDEEADRAVVRLQEGHVRRARAVKQRIRALLLFHGIECPKFSWGPRGVALLRSLAVDKRLKFVLESHLADLQHHLRQVRESRLEISRLCKSERLAAKVEVLQTVPGVGLLTAARVTVEMPSPQRFEKRAQVSKYQGLCPETSSSGETVRDLGHTQSGNPRLRATLVEAAWAWVRYDLWAKALYGHYLQNTGNSKKAIVAVARRLGVILWRMMVTGQAYAPPALEPDPEAAAVPAPPEAKAAKTGKIRKAA